MTLRYTHPSAPAASPEELLSYLAPEHVNEFVYRGQTQDWPGPLLPSAYRYHKQLGEVVDANSSPTTSIQKVGRFFHRLHPTNLLADFVNAVCCEPFSEKEIKLLDTIIDNSGFSVLFSKNGCNALKHVLSPEDVSLYSNHYPIWKKTINHTHRSRIRQLVCLNGFGYVLGMALAQHYGFSSEALDVSRNLQVAAFFARFESPSFLTPKHDGLGVIFRFTLKPEQLCEVEWHRKDLYCAPGFIDLIACLKAVTVACDQALTSPEDVVKHVLMVLKHGKTYRMAHQIQFSHVDIAQTRVARQAGALLFPDLIVDDEKYKPGTRKYIAVEDLRTREGTTAFYFRQNADVSPNPAIGRECLWPQHEVFVDMFEGIMGPKAPFVVHPTGIVLPKRPDLIDHGFAR